MADHSFYMMADEDGGWHVRPSRCPGMRYPARCTMCSHVYDMGKVTVTGRYTDCSVWKCPGCGVTVDDRPVGWGAHHYIELNPDGSEKR